MTDPNSPKGQANLPKRVLARLASDPVAMASFLTGATLGSLATALLTWAMTL